MRTSLDEDDVLVHPPVVFVVHVYVKVNCSFSFEHRSICHLDDDDDLDGEFVRRVIELVDRILMPRNNYSYVRILRILRNNVRSWSKMFRDDRQLEKEKLNNLEILVKKKNVLIKRSVCLINPSIIVCSLSLRLSRGLPSLLKPESRCDDADEPSLDSASSDGCVIGQVRCRT